MEPDAARKRTATACEACRATKVRCRPSEVSNVCQKCLVLKRECISRTCPRPRRSKRALESQHSSSASLSGPSSTFTINFTTPARSEPDDGSDFLQDLHMQSVDRLFRDHSCDTQSWAAGVQTPDTLPAQPKPLSVHEGHAKPLFNLVSAESLLRSFRCDKLKHLPCIVLPGDASVPHLAATRPFVLLAILAASSGSKTLKAHGLYDDEFRRVLGHKFVASCERSLELLQGILIYSSWYPFHLRPKEKQARRCLSMAADLIGDLELAPELHVDVDVSGVQPTDRQLDGIRAYLTYVYVSSTQIISWRTNPGIPNLYSSSTFLYCDILESNARVEGDAVLAALCRNSCALQDASQVMHEYSGQQDHHRWLVLSGLSAKLSEARGKVSPVVASSITYALQSNFMDVYLDCGSLLRMPRGKQPSHGEGGVLPLLPDKVHDCVVKLRMLLDRLAVLDDAVFLSFTLDDWTRLILTVILSLRLSFPMPECPQFDTSWARTQLRFDQALDRLCGETDSTSASKKHDVVSASRVILGVVRNKYHCRLRALEEGDSAPIEMANGCPMFDSSLQPFLPLWEADIGQSPPTMTMPSWSDKETAVPPPVFHDLWATMTMNWAGRKYD